MLSDPATGNNKRRNRALPTGYSRIPARSVSRMKATTAKPVNAPITSARTRNTWSSRCCSLALRCNNGVLHQPPLVIWPLSLISRERPRRAYLTGLPLEGGSESCRRGAYSWKWPHSAFRSGRYAMTPGSSGNRNYPETGFADICHSRASEYGDGPEGDFRGVRGCTFTSRVFYVKVK